MRFEFFIAWRYLISRKGSFFISRLIVISILTVGIAVMIPVITLSIVNGFHGSIREKVIASNFEMTVQGKYGYFPNYEEVLKDLEGKSEWVELGVPYFEKQGLIGMKGSRAIFPVTVKAFRNRDLLRNRRFMETFQILNDPFFYSNGDKKGGSAFQIEDEREMIIGDALSRYMNILNGDEVLLLIPQGDIELDFDSEENIQTFKVSKVYSAGYAKFNTSLVFINFKSLDSVFGFNALPTHIGVNLKKDMDLEGWIEREYPDLKVRDTLEGGVFKNFFQEKSLMTVLLLFLFIFAFISIYIGVYVLVLDKQKEIAMLKTFGLSDGRVRKIFVIEGFSIGLIGTLLGNTIGILIVSSLRQMIGWIEDVVNGVIFFGFNLMDEGLDLEPPRPFYIMDPSVFYLETIPYALDESDLFLLCMGGVLVSMIGAYFSSKKGLKKNIAYFLRSD